jgi:NTE family protein
LNDGMALIRREHSTVATSSDPSAGVLTRWWAGLRSHPSRLNLALQGGGAHGAFTWGVLDALLDDSRIHFEGLSGSSAGAMNAVLLADGWSKGGRDGARQSLTDFWTAVGKQLPSAMVTQGQTDDIDLSPASKLLANWAGYFSPSQLNPFDLNPLRALLERLIDFERLRKTSPFKLFVGATRASNGKLRVFREHELTLDMLLASACLPKIHHPVEIDGDAYWDGGYSANPAVFPLFYDCDARDVLLVLLGPLTREGTPRTVEEIDLRIAVIEQREHRGIGRVPTIPVRVAVDLRIAELAFSAHFMREMRMFAQATAFTRPSVLQHGRLEKRLQQMRFHMIDADNLASLQRTQTKVLAYGPFLERLRAQGRERGSAWLSQHSMSIGQRSTIDVNQHFG